MIEICLLDKRRMCCNNRDKRKYKAKSENTNPKDQDSLLEWIREESVEKEIEHEKWTDVQRQIH